jgi:hypothetical protein
VEGSTAIRTFGQIAALSLTLGAAFFLAKGTLGLSPEVIAELSVTKFGYNRAVLESLAGQAADSQVGVVLLVLAFALQLSTAIRPTRWVDFEVSRRGVVAALVVSLIVCALGYAGAAMRASRIAAQVTRIVDARVAAPQAAR